MLNQLLIFLLEALFGLFSLTLLLRFYVQFLRIPHHSPLSQFLMVATDFIVRPARRVIPELWGKDLATLLLAWLIQSFLLAGTQAIQGLDFHSTIRTTVIEFGLLGLIEITRTALHIILVAVIIQIALSWLNPRHPAGALIDSFTQHLLKIFRKRIPRIGNVDLSSLFILFIIQLLLLFLTNIQRGFSGLF